ncbi:MAG TPA: ABC transporter permease [Tepidisphaeraceae bacterium]|jgi:ribose transport system permease protein|nr:ABC transporter permease [Tepidisphaeraceae bacterium]
MSTLDYQAPTVPASGMFDWRELLKRLGPLVGLLFVFTVFSLLSPKTFLTTFNMRILLVQTTIVGIATLGMTVIIISGGIDLSVGSNVAFCTVIVALLLVAHVPPMLAALGGIGAGFLVGAVIGTLITAARLLPFIVTLALMGSLRGIAIGASGTGGVVYPPEEYRSTWIASLLDLRSEHWWSAVPAGPWVLLFLAILVAAILRYTKFGRHVFAIGSNEQTARLCGVNVWRTKLMVYSMAGALVGVAALMQFSQMFQGDATGAVGLELYVIAAAVIGGASLSGGEGTIVGSLAGAFMMSAVENGCQKMGWKDWHQLIITGGIILVAAWLDQLRHRRTT